ncbi:hypothetical protein [Streptomyces sp. HUAS TT7]|uniref:hypothetical protein n=1 Tax=Streptomyces sp. HUAS TT7 TaxID=3447507 RepID=UPI003F655B4B
MREDFWTLSVMYEADGVQRFRTIDGTRAPAPGDTRQLLYREACLTAVHDYGVPQRGFTVLSFITAPNAPESHREHFWYLTVLYAKQGREATVTIDGLFTPMPQDTRRGMYRHACTLAEKDNGVPPEYSVLAFDLAPNALA